MRNVLIVARKEIQEGLRNRWVLATTRLLAALALTLSFLGSAPTGSVGMRALDVAGRQVLLLFRTGASDRPNPVPGGVVPPHDAHGRMHVCFAIPADALDAKKKAPGADAKPMKVILVSDIDWIIPSFFFIREGGDENFLPATQNVPFILNIIDTLAGDDRFVEIRKRARIHRTLAVVPRNSGSVVTACTSSSCRRRSRQRNVSSRYRSGGRLFHWAASTPPGAIVRPHSCR